MKDLPASLVPQWEYFPDGLMELDRVHDRGDEVITEGAGFWLDARKRHSHQYSVSEFVEVPRRKARAA